MTPPLTRETLAEIRRLRGAVTLAQAAADKALDDGIGGNLPRLRRRRDRAVTKLREALHRHCEALLAAAERGLDVEDGR